MSMRLKPKHVFVAAMYLLAGSAATQGAFALIYHANWNATASFYLLTMVCIGIGALVQTKRDLS